MVSKKKKSKEQVLQEKGYEFQLLKQQLNNVDKRLEEVGNKLDDFNRIKRSLEGIKNSEEGDELLIPLGEGLFIKANVGELDEVLLGVGGSVLVGKSLSEAVNYVDDKIDQADEMVNRLNKNAQEFVNRLRDLEPELLELTRESRR